MTSVLWIQNRNHDLDLQYASNKLGGFKMGEFKVLVDAWQASPSLMAQAVMVLPLVVAGMVLVSVIVGWLLRRLI